MLGMKNLSKGEGGSWERKSIDIFIIVEYGSKISDKFLQQKLKIQLKL